MKTDVKTQFTATWRLEEGRKQTSHPDSKPHFGQTNSTNSSKLLVKEAKTNTNTQQPKDSKPSQNNNSSQLAQKALTAQTFETPISMTEVIVEETEKRGSSAKFLVRFLNAAGAEVFRLGTETGVLLGEFKCHTLMEEEKRRETRRKVLKGLFLDVVPSLERGAGTGVGMRQFRVVRKGSESYVIQPNFIVFGFLGVWDFWIMLFYDFGGFF